MLPIECIVRGYLAGQAHEEYEQSGTVHGTAMPAGLKLADRLAEPIFTPSTKADEGHDLNIDFAQAVDLVGAEAAHGGARHLPRALRAGGGAGGRRRVHPGRHQVRARLRRRRALACATRCARPTPPACGRPIRWSPGSTPPAFDKQPLRDWLAAQPLGPHAPAAAAPGRA